MEICSVQTNRSLALETIQEKGLKVTAVAEKMGLTPAGLYKKLNNVSEFKASEILSFAQAVDTDFETIDNIFFAGMLKDFQQQAS